MTVSEPVARAHAECLPVTGKRYALGLERHGEVQNLPTFLRVLVGRRGDQEVTLRRAAGEGLAGGDAKPALDLLAGPVRGEPVVGAGADKDRLLTGDPLQQLLAGLAVAVVEDRGRHQVLMHRQGQGRRAAVGCQRPQEGAHLPMARPAAAKLARHQRREDLVLSQGVVVIGNEGGRCVPLGRAFGEAGTQFLNQGPKIDNLAHDARLQSKSVLADTLASARSREQL